MFNVAVLIFSIFTVLSRAQQYPAEAGSGCKIATVPLSGFNALSLLSALQSIQTYGAQYGIASSCVTSAATNLASCLSDLGNAEGCCSVGCWNALQGASIAGPCSDSLILGSCAMAAANLPGMSPLLLSLFPTVQRCSTSLPIPGTLYNCTTFAAAFAPPSSPSPVPSPLPSPVPSPVPSPLPSPVPSPLPSPIHSPTPSPVPSPVPSPKPSPVFSPLPSPVPSPAYSPKPSRKKSPSHRPSHKSISFLPPHKHTCGKHKKCSKKEHCCHKKVCVPKGTPCCAA
jgi:hypothetical protein